MICPMSYLELGAVPGWKPAHVHVLVGGGPADLPLLVSWAGDGVGVAAVQAQAQVGGRHLQPHLVPRPRPRPAHLQHAAAQPRPHPAPGHQLHLQLVAVTVHQQPSCSSCPSCPSCSCVCPELEAELCGVGGTAGPPGRELGVAGGGALQLEGTATTRLYSQIRY